MLLTANKTKKEIFLNPVLNTPLGKAFYWEIFAVPDIRVQAAQVAEAIAREFNHVG